MGEQRGAEEGAKEGAKEEGRDVARAEARTDMATGEWAWTAMVEVAKRATVAPSARRTRCKRFPSDS